MNNFDDYKWTNDFLLLILSATCRDSVSGAVYNTFSYKFHGKKADCITLLTVINLGKQCPFISSSALKKTLIQSVLHAQKLVIIEA